MKKAVEEQKIFRNWDCPKYSECLGEAAKNNKKTFDCTGCEMANYLDPNTIEKIKTNITKGQKGKFKAVRKTVEKQEKKMEMKTFIQLAKEEYEKIDNRIEELRSEVKQNAFELGKLYALQGGITEFLGMARHASNLRRKEAYDEFIYYENEDMQALFDEDKGRKQRKETPPEIMSVLW